MNACVNFCYYIAWFVWGGENLQVSCTEKSKYTFHYNFFSQESCDVGDNYKKDGIGRGAKGIVTYMHVCCGLI